MPIVEPARSRMGWSKKQNWVAAFASARRGNRVTIGEEAPAEREDEGKDVLGDGGRGFRSSGRC